MSAHADEQTVTGDAALVRRHFASYTGVRLPLKLITPLDDAELERRITFFRGYFDACDQLVTIEKVVYGEIEFTHHYAYHDDGRIKRAALHQDDEEPRILSFD